MINCVYLPNQNSKALMQTLYVASLVTKKKIIECVFVSVLETVKVVLCLPGMDLVCHHDPIWRVLDHAPQRVLHPRVKVVLVFCRCVLALPGFAWCVRWIVTGKVFTAVAAACKPEKCGSVTLAYFEKAQSEKEGQNEICICLKWPLLLRCLQLLWAVLSSLVVTFVSSNSARQTFGGQFDL